MRRTCRGILTNITDVSQKLFSTIPRRGLDVLSRVKWHDALEKGDVVEQHFVSFNLRVVILMDDTTQVDIPADNRAGLVGRLTPVDLLVDVGSIKLRSERGKFDRPITVNLPAKREKDEKIYSKKNFHLARGISFCREILSHPSLNVT